jgi:hypothetical protein
VLSGSRQAHLKNKVGKGVRFLVVKKRPSTHQLYHAFHHNFTTKTPRSAHRFSQNPLQKHLCTTDLKNLWCRGVKLLLFVLESVHFTVRNAHIAQTKGQ